MDSKDIALFAGVAVAFLLGVGNLIYNILLSRRTAFINTVTSERLTENELSDFSQLWHTGCVKQQQGRNMWTEITRPKYERKEQRYESDVTDGEWAVIEPQLPGKRPLGRPREVELRAVVDALLYIARTGCQWRQLPREFPPFTTVQHYFYAWRDSGVLEKT